jgi:hypothetical protein
MHCMEDRHAETQVILMYIVDIAGNLSMLTQTYEHTGASRQSGQQRLCAAGSFANTGMQLHARKPYMPGVLLTAPQGYVLITKMWGESLSSCGSMSFNTMEEPAQTSS